MLLDLSCSASENRACISVMFLLQELTLSVRILSFYRLAASISLIFYKEPMEFWQSRVAWAFLWSISAMIFLVSSIECRVCPFRMAVLLRDSSRVVMFFWSSTICSGEHLKMSQSAQRLWESASPQRAMSAYSQFLFSLILERTSVESRPSLIHLARELSYLSMMAFLKLILCWMSWRTSPLLIFLISSVILWHIDIWFMFRSHSSSCVLAITSSWFSRNSRFSRLVRLSLSSLISSQLNDNSSSSFFNNRWYSSFYFSLQPSGSSRLSIFLCSSNFLLIRSTK